MSFQEIELDPVSPLGRVDCGVMRTILQARRHLILCRFGLLFQSLRGGRGVAVLLAKSSSVKTGFVYSSREMVMVV